MCMRRYYKIVSNNSCFSNVYNIADVSAIPNGTQFVGKNLGGQRQDTSVSLTGAVLHFSDNAFDTMLWYDMLVDGLSPKAQIYEVKPLAPMVKKRVNGGIGVFQCGANTIEFVKPINVSHMFKSAIAEFRKNPKAKIQMYPDLNMSKLIASWAKNERSKLVY